MYSLIDAFTNYGGKKNTSEFKCDTNLTKNKYINKIIRFNLQGGFFNIYDVIGMLCLTAVQ